MSNFGRGFLTDLVVRRCLPLAAMALMELCLRPSPSEAQNLWQLNGEPICLHPVCGGLDVAITADDSGGVFLRFKTDVNYDGSNPNGNYDIYLTHVLADGHLDPRWPLSGVAASLEAHNQYAEDMVSDGTGGVYVLWQDYRGGPYSSIDLFAQHILGNGALAPGWPPDGLPVVVAPGEQRDGVMMADGSGGVYVGWSDLRADVLGELYLLRLLPDGTRAGGWAENGTLVSPDPSYSVYPSMCSDGGDGVLVAWFDQRDGGALYAQHLRSDGSIAEGWQASGNPIVSGQLPGTPIGLVTDDDGGAYLGLDVGPDFEHDAYLTRFTGGGVVAPGWSASGTIACATTNSQIPRSIASDGVGGVLMTWTDYRPGGQGVYAIRMLPDGTRATGWQPCGNRVSDIGGSQSDPIITPDGTGGAYVTFQAGPRAFIQKLTAQGGPAPGWTTSAVFVDLPGSGQSSPSMASDARGGAITAWLDARNGNFNQIFAQRYAGDGPTPVQVSLVSVNADPDRVTLTWHTPSSGGVAATIYRRTVAAGWAELTREQFDGEGRLRYEDLAIARSARYAYRLGIVENGAESFTEETWVDVPAAYELALEGLRPNPAVRDLRVAFTLPSNAPASLELIDIGGRQVMSRAVSDLGAGRHLVQLGDARRVPPGVYWVRLTQGHRSHTMRAVVIR